MSLLDELTTRENFRDYVNGVHVFHIEGWMAMGREPVLTGRK